MLDKYKPSIILFCSIAVIMILFPPVAFIGSVTRDKGYDFLFSISSSYSLNVSKLIIQLFLALFFSALFQFIYEQIKKSKMRK